MDDSNSNLDGIRRPLFAKSTNNSNPSRSRSRSRSPSSGQLAAFFLKAPFRGFSSSLRRKGSRLSLFPRSNTAPSDLSLGGLHCFGKLHSLPSPLSQRPSIQTQLVELHCPLLQKRHSRELLQYNSHQSSACSLTDLEDDGQGGYGGDEVTDKYGHHTVLDVVSSSHIDATTLTTNHPSRSRRMLASQSNPGSLSILEQSKSSSFTSTPLSVRQLSSSSSSVAAAAAAAAAAGGKDDAIISRTSLGDLSAYSSSYPGESSNVVMGSYGILAPKNSILRNPSNKKTFVDAWRPKDGSGPAVLQIQARQSVRDRELEKEKERVAREKEIERELKEMEQAEKVWGIPKKAFYMGLGEINFNAQMAMLGGWGNGSGPATDFRPNMTPPVSRKISSTKTRSKRVREREKEKREAIQRAEQRRSQKEKEKDNEEDSDGSIDPEELASLNAIINTRRSMEAAQALASRSSRHCPNKKSISRESLLEGVGGDEASSRPPLEELRQLSNDSFTTRVDSSAERKTADDTSRSSSRTRPDFIRSSSEARFKQSRIRFAPLPQAYGTTPLQSPSQLSEQMQEQHLFENPPMRSPMEMLDKSPGEGPADDESDSSDMDEPEEGEEGWGKKLSVLGGSKSRWYLMGMPKNVFKTPNSRSSRSRPSSVSGLESVLAGELSSSLGAERMERRGRRRSRLRRSTSLAGSIKSRSSSVGSNDEEERNRRRQLIRASRPGGTGMVTLPDGTRIRARRVGEEESEEEDFNEWGFAGLSRRRSIEDVRRTSEDAKTGEKRASDDERGEEEEEDEASGMAWVKRRRRAREESGNSRQKEQQDDALQNGTSTLDLAIPIKKHSDGSDRLTTKNLLPPPSLSTLQAAEVRRRHEEEVAALGAEVLQNIAKAKKGRQPPSRSSTWDATQTTSIQEKPSTAKSTTLESIVEPPLQSKMRGRPRRTVSLHEEEAEEEERPRLTPLTVLRTAESRSSSQSAAVEVMPSSPQVLDQLDGLKTPTGIETPKRKVSSTTRETPAVLQSPSIIGSDEQEDFSRKAVVPIESESTNSSSKETRTSSPNSSTSSPNSKAPGSPAQSTSSNVVRSPSSSSTSYFASTPYRRASGHSVMTIPSPNLPRKPDARGYAVVPLPIHQLGTRPERPREGRVWQFDDVDDSDEDESRERGNGNDDEEEEDDDDDDSDSDGEEEEEGEEDDKEEEEEEDEESTMNAEELAEEERRTAIQKKRATTRAAGAEIVSSVAKPMAGASSNKLPRSPKKKSIDEVDSVKMDKSKEKNATLPKTPPPPGKEQSQSSARSPPMTIPTRSNKKQGKGVIVGKQGDGNESDISDDLDLWPPTLSGTQLSRTLSHGESVQSSNGSLRNARESVSLAAHSAKARILRDRKSKEAKEKERVKKLRRKEEQDLDYGWPRSLQGSSLY